MTRFLPLCVLLAACFHDPQVNRDIALTTIGAAITAAGVFVWHVQDQQDNVGPGDALAPLLTLGGGIMMIVESVLLVTDAAYGPRPQ
ncbi:MAG TPA: hypothetical protein VGO00_13290 [Kofleriaceae bacterium]|nr:hypothetical protein [Kofleriaceae bacterium]